jgi:hypothetical protein
MIARHWGTTSAERALAFPGDRPADAGADLLWRGVGIEAPHTIVFQWLCQLRVAPYSYDWIDNGGRRSPRTLDPSLLRLERGQTFMRIFRLEEFEPGVQVTLATPIGSRGAHLFGVVRVSYWARAEEARRTRLLVKLRVAPAPGAWGRAMRAFLPWGDLLMMRRQLLDLKALAEATARTGDAGAGAQGRG